MDNIYQIAAIIIGVSWLIAISSIYLIKNKLISTLFALIGILSLLLYIIFIWIKLERPPMRTIGETRLWYSFFISIIGFVIYQKWRYKWFYLYCL